MPSGCASLHRQFQDCKATRYLDEHPGFTKEDKQRYLKHPKALLLELA